MALDHAKKREDKGEHLDNWRIWEQVVLPLEAPSRFREWLTKDSELKKRLNRCSQVSRRDLIPGLSTPEILTRVNCLTRKMSHESIRNIE